MQTQTATNAIARMSFVDRLLATSPECIYVFDVVDQRLVYRNRCLYEMLGYKRSDVERPNAVIPSQFLAPEDRIDVARLFAQLRRAKRGAVIVTEFRMQCRNGHWRHYSARLTPLSHDHRGQTVEVLGMISDITPQKTAESTLRRLLEHQNDEALRKERFWADVSHEIRTPLNGLLGATALLARTSLSSEQTELVGILSRASDALLGLVDNVLDHSKMSAGQLTLVDAPFNLRTIVDEALGAFAERIASKGLNAYAVFDAAVPSMLLGDAARVRQILLNLLSNAVKFTEHGDIRIDVQLLDVENGRFIVRTTIKDDGPGLNAHEREAVFLPYTQLASDTSHGRSGTGLGLPICRQLAELMEGSMGVDSVEGKGSAFYLDVPFKSTPVAVGSARPLEGRRCRVLSDHRGIAESLEMTLGAAGATILGTSDKGRDGDSVVHVMTRANSAVRRTLERSVNKPKAGATLLATPLGDLYKQAEANTSRWSIDHIVALPFSAQRLLAALAADQVDTSAPAVRTGAKPLYSDESEILVVDDNEENLRVAAKMIERCGARCITAKSGHAALRLLSNGLRPKLILIDCQMPDLDGWETTRAMRRMSAAKAIPIVALTASATKDAERDCLDAGMNAVLTKPLRLATLDRCLEQWAPTEPLTQKEA